MLQRTTQALLAVITVCTILAIALADGRPQTVTSVDRCRASFPHIFYDTVPFTEVGTHRVLTTTTQTMLVNGTFRTEPDMTVQLPTAYNGTTTIERNGTVIRCQPVGAQSSIGQVQDDGTILYPEVHPGIDAVHHGSNSGIEEFLIVHEPPAKGIGEWHWQLALEQADGNRVTPTVTADGRIILTDVNNTPQAIMTAPIARDANGRLLSDDHLAWNLVDNKLKLRADLREAHFPVVIDPSWQTPSQAPKPAQVATHGLMGDGRLIVLSTTVYDETDFARDYSGKLAQIFDPITNSWTEAAPWPYSGRPHAAIPANNGTTIVVFWGSFGYSGTYYGMTTVASYDSNLGTWTNLAFPEECSSLCQLDNGDILFINYDGDNSYTLNTANFSWSAAAALTPEVIEEGPLLYLNPTMTSLPGGDCLIIGKTKTARFNSELHSWSNAADLPRERDYMRDYHKAITLADGNAFYFLTKGSFGPPNWGYNLAYEKENNTWQSTQTLSPPIAGNYIALPDNSLASHSNSYDISSELNTPWPVTMQNTGVPHLLGNKTLLFTGAQQIPALGFTPEHYYPIVTKLDLRPAVTATEQTTHWRNTPLTIDLAPLIDSRGNSPTATIVDQPTSGSLAQDGLTLTYTPTDSQFVGTDSFTVQAADEFYPAGPTVAIPIVYTNDSPIATSVGVNHSEDQTLNGMLNGSDANDDPLTFAITSQPDIGSVVLTDTTTGAFTYTPPANTSGTTSFAYTVSDGPSTVSATLTITVLPVNEAPDFTLIAEADIVAPETRTAFTQQHIASFTPGPANEASQTVLAYLVSVDRPDLFASQPAIDPSGLLTFTPSGTVSEASTATVTVQVQDNGGTANGGLDTSAAQTFTITIEPVADTLVVTTTADAGPGSLRDQLGLARSGDTITFDETTFHVDNSGAATVINILSPLPPLSHGGVTIDASDRKVSLNGSAAPAADGLVISSADNTVTGLTILAFTQNGIRLTGSAQGNVLGGTRAIGSGPNGQGLRIADCGGHGIHLDGPGVTDNIVEGCWVGLFASGLLTGPNLAGVVLENGANNNRIGSTEPDQGNVISGNTYEGIAVIGSGSSNNVIIGNLIGLTAVEEWLGDSWGHSVLGNGSAGIFLSLGTQNNRIGGLETGEGNAIYGSGGPGIEIRTAASAGNTALGNAISQNAGAGIGIFNGANDDVQPPTIITLGGDDEPELTNRSIGTDIKFLSGRTSKPSGVVQLFTDPGDEGEELIATVSVADGIWSASIPPIPTGRNLTATFTDELGNTSQFRSTNPGVFNRRIAVGLLDTDEEVQPVLDDHIAIPMVDGMATTPPVSRTEDHDIGFVPQPQSGG